MKARNWVLAASAIGVVLAMPNIVRQMPRAGASSDPEPKARAVRIEHEFITLPAATPLAEKTDRVVPATLQSTHVAQPSVTPPRTLAQRARRALLGDGRHRPEPFPVAR